MQYFDVIAVIVVLLLAIFYLARSWTSSIRRTARGESACSSCSGECASKPQDCKPPEPSGMPLGDLRKHR